MKDSAICGTEFVKCGITQVECGTVDAAGAACGTVCDGKVERALGQFVGEVKLSIGSEGLRGEVCHEF